MKDRLPRWTALRPIGNSPALRLTIFIPVIGYLIVFNDVLIRYVALTASLFGEVEIGGVPTRLIQLYLGLCGTGLGSAIFSLRCPPKVAHYGDAAAFVRGDSPALKDYSLQLIEEELADSRYDAEYESIKAHYDPPLSTGLPAPKAAEKGEVNNALLHLYFRLLNESRPIARLSCSVSYLVGFIFLALPSLHVFFVVLRHAVAIIWQKGFLAFL